MNTILPLFFCYSVLLLGLSLLASRRRAGGKGDFLFARGQLSSLLVAVTVAATGVGGVATIGIAEVAFTKGLSAANYNYAWALSSIVAGLVFVPRLHRMSVQTLPEMMRLVFGPLAGAISLVIQFFLLTTLVAAQYVAGASILRALFPGVFTQWQAMLFCAGLFTLITFLGGYHGVSLTNIVNVTVILFGLLAGAVVLLSRHGAAMEELPADTAWTHPFRGVGSAQLFIWYITAAFSKLGNQSVIHTVFSARDERAARRGYVLAGLLVAPVGPLSAVFGLAARAEFPLLADAAEALPAAAATLPPLISGLTLVAIFAAVVSTASGTLLSSAALLEPALKRRVKATRQKPIVLGLVALTLLIAGYIDGLLEFGMLCAALMAPYSMLVACVLYVPALLRRSTMAVTMIAALLIQGFWMLPTGLSLPPVIYIHILSAFLCIFLCRRIDPRPVSTGSLLRS